MPPGTDAAPALRKLLHFSLLIALVATGLLPVSPGPAAADAVKLSSSGICHDANSRWFAKTKNYKAFGTMPECLLNGRAYKGFSGNAAPSVVDTVTAAPPRAPCQMWAFHMTATSTITGSMRTGTVKMRAMSCFRNSRLRR